MTTAARSRRAVDASVLVSASALRSSVARAAASRQPPQQPTFRASTRLIVQTVTVKDKDGNADRRADREGLHRHRGRRAAGHRVRRVPAARDRARTPRRAAARHACRRPSRRRAAHGGADVAPVSAASQIASPPTGDIRYRNRRLLVLYFDHDRDAAARSDARLRRGAASTSSTQMQPADLVAIMTYERRRRPREAGLHRRPRRAARGHRRC